VQLAGVLGYYIAGKELSAAAFATVTLNDVVDLWGLTVTYERELMPAVYETRKVPVVQSLAPAVRAVGFHVRVRL
jgi:hypothetical protein